MKSRTSFFNLTAFKKDIQRFAPAWGLYSLCLLLGLAGILMDGSSAYYNARGIANLLHLMAILNLCYAFVNAQLLFGDLFSSRMCNALHAMPLRRECWYGTHVVSGLAFSIVPNLVASLAALLVVELDAGWSVVPWWLLGSTLTYLCFFGISVFSMMLTGNRFAALLVYGIVNFFAMMVYWLADSLYEPLLTGIQLYQEPFRYFCPVVWMAGQEGFVEVLAQRIEDVNGDFLMHRIEGVVPSDSWLMLTLFALLGASLLALSLVMYRKRKLETAGDFSAFKAAEPVLLIIYTITAGGFFHLFADILGGSAVRYLFLAAGLVAGFFTGLMLLQRTTRVFRVKAFVRFGIFAAVFALTLVATWLDPLGITRWVPEADEIASVNLSSRYEHFAYSEGERVLTEEADIQNLIVIHEAGLAQAGGPFEEPGYIQNVNFCLRYEMKDGRTRTRFYEIDASSEAGQLLKSYYSSFEYITGYTEDQIPELADKIFDIYSSGARDNTREYQEFVKTLDVEQLLRAIAADCAAGNMAQFGAYHLRYNDEGLLTYGSETYLDMNLRQDSDWNIIDSIYIRVYQECTNTLNWMTENGLYDPDAEHK